MDILQSPFYIQVAFYSLVVFAGIPLVEGGTDMLTSVQYYFTTFIIATISPIGLIALYHLATDQSLQEFGSLVNSVYFASFLLWIPFFSVILIGIRRRKQIRKIFKNILEHQELLRTSISEFKVKLLLVLATVVPIVHSLFIFSHFFLNFGRFERRLGPAFKGRDVVTAITFIPACSLWSCLYYNTNLLHAFQLRVLDVIGQFANAPRPTSVLSLVSENCSSTRIARVEDTSPIKWHRSRPGSAHVSSKYHLARFLKWKELRNLINQTYYVSWVIGVFLNTYSFLTILKLEDGVITTKGNVTFVIAMPLATSLAVTLCGFSTLCTAKKQQHMTIIKKKVYFTPDVRERRVLTIFTSSITDDYPEHACVFFSFNFELLGLVLETVCLVLTSLYV